jgi:hypothetical protein
VGPRPGEEAEPIPRMRGRRFDQGARSAGGPGQYDGSWAVEHAVIGQRAVLMQEAERAIHALFDEDMRRLHAILDLVEGTAMHDRPIAPQHTPSPQGEHRPHIGFGRQGAVQIGAMRWLDANQAGKNRFASARVATPASRISLTNRSCSV